MMKSRYKIWLLFILISFSVNAYTQSDLLKVDSLKKLLLTEKEDTDKVNTLNTIASAYKAQGAPDESLSYYFDALKLAEKIGNKESLFKTLYLIAGFYMNQFDNALALEYALKAEQTAVQQNNKNNLFKIYDLIGGFIYFNEGKYNEAFEYGNKMMKIAEESKDKKQVAYMLGWFGDTYRMAKKPDSAIMMYRNQVELTKQLGDKEKIAYGLQGIGMSYAIKEDHKKAIEYFLQAIAIGDSEHFSTANFTFNTAQAYFNLKQYTQAVFYAKLSLESYKEDGHMQMQLYRMLSQISAAANNYKEAYFNTLRYTALQDSLASIELQKKINTVESNYKAEKQNKEIDFLQKQAKLQNTLRNVMIAASILLIIIAGLIASKYREKKKSEIILNSKNNKLIQTLDELKSAQSQLIQSEKMASLGELTAGIAHEIQNPLNFVNNFSEVNKELLAELKDEINKGNIGDANAIADDVIGNEEKINHHGKRADAIVKGMLQHSKTSSGQKALTNINTLAEEYLRLSYHGFRAKDKSFDAIIQTDFDNNLEKINIIPQEIGRVLLNLYNNAFYAVAEKSKHEPEGYEPTVSVATKKTDDRIELTVKDNGNGIPQNIVDKIFQPFFTTKPTGQGTGLGLSLSYDIIKAHGGEIKVETKEGQGSTFIIQLLC